jgi:four helix bundle protein
VATVKTFEEMLAWQKARLLNFELHTLLKNTHDPSFNDQIFRAAVSIMNNIAEGFERSSDREFRQFLNIAKGSAGEVRSMLYLALDFGYIARADYEIQLCACQEISKLLAAFIRHLTPKIT